MKRITGKKLLCIVILLHSAILISAQENNINKREHVQLDTGWLFAFGHPSDVKKDFGNGTGYFSYFAKAGYGDGAAAANFDDRAWRKLDLPHDWAVEQPFSSDASFSHGFKAIGRNFPNASVGWYRKSFFIPQTDLGRRISIQFDGVFRNSIVWVNGHYLGTHESGYTGFQYDITDYLNYAGNNVIAVRVDATMEEGWFYEGAGIYRHVWLNKTNPLHVATNGTFIASAVNGNNAAITAKTEVANDGTEKRTVDVLQTIVDAEGRTVATAKSTGISIIPFETKEVTTNLPLANPHLWNLEVPYRYKIITAITDGNTTTDIYETRFGIRTIRFDAKEGFFLNGKNIKLKGTNNHQDHAGVGAAMPDALQYFRIKTLKEIGSNAYRASHNPPAPEFLNACDSLGMLVLDENRLMGTTTERLNEVKQMIVRDRNHPSIISWSIGNEEWAIENNIIGERIATTLQNFVKSLDTTRPATAGISGGFQSGISSVLEVMGYNYMGNGNIEAHHNKFLNQPGMGTEEGSTFATRGIYITDKQKHYHAAYDKKPRPTFFSIEEAWKFYATRPYLAGMFIWTGFDYRGEPTPYGWPSVTSYFGMMDLCGFPKDNVYYLRSWWGNKPVLHLLPHWNWQGQEGKEIDVWAYSNCDEVEVFLNKKTLGKKKMEQYGHLEWKVNYQSGTLEAIGYKEGKKIISDVAKTTSSPISVALAADRSVLKSGGDVAVIAVQVEDKNHLHVPVADDEISFTINGPGKIIGVGNGNPTSLEKERFIEDIQTVTIENLKEKQVDGIQNRTEITSDYNDASWKQAFEGRTHLDSAKAYVYRGTFNLPAGFSQSEVSFFYKSLGTEQSIYINGKLIGENLKQDKIGNEFKLDKTFLKEGSNVIAIIALPIRKRYEWDNINTDPGTIQMVTQPSVWKRKLFNGYAQVIVQTTKGAGEITLTATSGNLKAGVIKIKSVENSLKE
ncbi:MAG: beta-galactosidase GalA [Ginsengibacter sp.]